MKRLRPLSLTEVRSDEYRLRCKPDFNQIAEAEYETVLRSFRARSVDKNAADKNIESDFVFEVNDRGGVIQDDHFFHITGDDYGEMWINKSITSFWVAARNGISASGKKLTPFKLICDAAYNEQLRLYKVLFENGSEVAEQIEWNFAVSGKGDARTITWDNKSFEATWSERNWSFIGAPPSDLKPLLTSVLRMDEAIHLELMPYAMT